MKMRATPACFRTGSSRVDRNCRLLIVALPLVPGRGPVPTKGVGTLGTAQVKPSIASRAASGSW